ncbi:MAG: hypothetical protein ACYC61_27180 [Isosphaeraceae bacterium]
MMTAAVQQLLRAFDALTAFEQREAAVEILHRAPSLEAADLPDEALISAAEELFLELDAREAADAEP